MKKREITELQKALKIMQRVSRSANLSDSDRSEVAQRCESLANYLEDSREFQYINVKKTVTINEAQQVQV